MNGEKRINHISTGSSDKEWIATHPGTGNFVRTPAGERTVFRCGAREAERFERQHGIYLREVQFEARR